MNRVNSPKALKWLLDDATRDQCNKLSRSSLPTANAEESSGEASLHKELCQKARAIISDRADPFELAQSSFLAKLGQALENAIESKVDGLRLKSFVTLLVLARNRSWSYSSTHLICRPTSMGSVSSSRKGEWRPTTNYFG